MATPIPPNQARMTLPEILAATGGRLRPARPGPAIVEGFTTDSRAVVSGCGFIALRGAAHDGHEFVRRAVEGGAGLVVVEAGRAREVDGTVVSVVEVEDTLDAWGALARAHLRAWRRGKGAIVAITGSAGKTTTKELCASLLGLFGRCHATPGNAPGSARRSDR